VFNNVLILTLLVLSARPVFVTCLLSVKETLCGTESFEREVFQSASAATSTIAAAAPSTSILRRAACHGFCSPGSTADNARTNSPAELKRSAGTLDSAFSAARSIVTGRVSRTTRSFTVGGQVTGAIGSGLRIQNTVGDAGDAGIEELAIADAGPFTFDGAVPSGQTYSVTISNRPTFAGCNVSNGSAVMAGANVSNVAVACAAGSTVGGSSQAATNALPADTLLARPVTIASAATAHTIGGYFVNAGCNVRFALYANAAGVPGALLGTTGEIITGSSGASEGALTSPVALPAGTYWVALLSLTTCNGYFAPTGGPGYYARPAVPYTGPFPNPFGTEKCATPLVSLCVRAPPSCSFETSSWVTVLSTSGPVTNM
jgi:hypothetical protein